MRFSITHREIGDEIFKTWWSETFLKTKKPNPVIKFIRWILFPDEKYLIWQKIFPLYSKKPTKVKTDEKSYKDKIESKNNKIYLYL